MSDFEYWHLCDQLTIVQAALLIAGYDPASYEGDIECDPPSKQPLGYAACRQALIGAIEQRRLKGFLHYDEFDDIDGKLQRKLNVSASSILTDGIADWLRARGMRKGFFLPEDDSPKEYLDPEHERFAPKLAAAVLAWEAAGRDSTLKGTPKQRIEKWLRLHASEFGLTQKDGKPNESAIEAIARIANWKPEGGAPATPIRGSAKSPTEADAKGNVVALENGRTKKLKRLDPNGDAP